MDAGIGHVLSAIYEKSMRVWECGSVELVDRIKNSQGMRVWEMPVQY